MTVDTGGLMLTIRSLEVAITKFGMVNAVKKSLVVQNHQAGVAQLVERYLAKVQVDGSSPFTRSNFLQPPGQVAEWLCSGLQSRLRRFDSDPGLHFNHPVGG